MKDTKTRILDAAERLIMELGAEKASLRKITDEAGVNIAAINYHFGSKNNMISALMERFLAPLSKELHQSLDRVYTGAENETPELEAVIRAYLVPLLDFSLRCPDHQNFFIQMYRYYDDRDVFMQSIRGLVEKDLKYYAGAFLAALPQLPEKIVLLRLAFFRNTSCGIMQGDCIMEESMAVLGLDLDRKEMIGEMVTTVASGFRAGVKDKSSTKLEEEKHES
ncbi:MAG: TetR/AcrR family transcriptional regulator [Desulfobacteraceae bacterium]|nr:TetR/AcrR family transcriptional regulator [Desulfobacteraceae bacterium]